MTARALIGANAKPRAVVASAKRVNLDRMQRVGEPWQENLWDIYERLGPVHYGVQFKRNAAMKVTYFPVEELEENDEPEITENDQVLEAFERLGATEEHVGDFVAQENVAGEGYLVGYTDDEEEVFEVWSTIEVNRDKNATGKDKRLTEDDFLLRIWRPSPKRRKDPDSPLRSVQAQCEQLLLLNDEIAATAMSRIPAGFFLVPSELSFPTNPEDPPSDGANMDGDPFMAEIIAIMVEAIKNPDHAARVAPNLIRGPADLLKEVRHIDISRGMDETFANMREELLRQIAAGLDLPPEIILGKADLNHWSAWDVDDSAAKLHVDPDVLFVLDGLTRGYLWPALEEGGMNRDQARRFKIWRDYSDLTSRPLSLDQAEGLFDKGVINADHLRQIANLAESDAEIGPGDIAVRSEAVGVLFRAGFEPQAILTALGLPAIAHTGAAPVTVQSEDAIESVPGEGGPAGPDNVERQPPQVPGVTAAEAVKLTRLANIDASLSVRVIEASEAAFHRALERAGVRVRNKARKNREVTAAIKNVANHEITRHLGSMRIEALQITQDELLPGDEFDALQARVNEMLASGQDQTRDSLSTLFGEEVPKTDEETQDRLDAVDLFIAALFAAAAARLFTDAPDPDPAEVGEFSDEIATGQMVFELLTRAGGADVTEFTPDTPRGLALGQRTRALLRDHGYRTASETWEYGDITLRRFPYEPHVNLDGAQVEDREDPRLGGYFPGDHRFCRCRFVPTVLPES